MKKIKYYILLSLLIIVFITSSLSAYAASPYLTVSNGSINLDISFDDLYIDTNSTWNYLFGNFNDEEEYGNYNYFFYTSDNAHVYILYSWNDELSSYGAKFLLT